MFNFSIQKKDYLVAYSNIKGTTWFVVGTIPFTYLNGEVKQVGDYIIWIIIVFCICSLLISFLITRNISLPLNKLMASMLKAKDGELATEVKIETKESLTAIINIINTILKL